MLQKAAQLINAVGAKNNDDGSYSSVEDFVFNNSDYHQVSELLKKEGANVFSYDYRMENLFIRAFQWLGWKMGAKIPGAIPGAA